MSLFCSERNKNFDNKITSLPKQINITVECKDFKLYLEIYIQLLFR